MSVGVCGVVRGRAVCVRKRLSRGGAEQCSMPSQYLGLLGVATSLVCLAALVLVAWQYGQAPPGPARNLQDCTPVFLVTAGAVALLYAFLFNQSWTTFSEYEKMGKEAKSRGEKPPDYARLKYGNSNKAVTIF